MARTIQIPDGAWVLLLELVRQLGPVLKGLFDGDNPPDSPTPAAGRISRVRLRLLRAQYNRKLFPEQYTPDNPQGLYSGKELEAIRNGSGKLNRESNIWADLTAYGPDGVELQRDQLKRLGLAYRTEFFINDGSIIGHGANDLGHPNDWERTNPEGANISEEAWRTSLGFNVRIHVAEEGPYTVRGNVDGNEGEAFTVTVG